LVPTNSGDKKVAIEITSIFSAWRKTTNGYDSKRAHGPRRRVARRYKFLGWLVDYACDDEGSFISHASPANKVHTGKEDFWTKGANLVLSLPLHI
jgi:hypothetical protein